jgi:hypothetical protein
VNAREQLKRYLEQRRDMGETELVLDGLTVDEALRILGADAAGVGAKSGSDSESCPCRRRICRARLRSAPRRLARDAARGGSRPGD